jgi:Mrp family chromosome partitioning ATPase
MSRILKALATIESKGATLTLSLPAEAAPVVETGPQRPKRREGLEQAELSLAALEAYLQAALSAEQRTLLEAEADDTVELYCTPGEIGPSIGAPDLAAAELDPDHAITEIVGRDSGPTARYTFVDRDLLDAPWEEPAHVSESLADADELLASFDLAAAPSDEVIETAELEALDWDEAIYDLAPPLSIESPAPPAPELVAVVAPVSDFLQLDLDIDDLATIVIEFDGDQSVDSYGFLTETAGDATHELVEPFALQGWPDAFPLEAEIEPEPTDYADIDVDAAVWLVEPPEFAWLEAYDLNPAEAHEQTLLAPPDWIEVDAAVEALPLVVEAPKPVEATPLAPERTLARRRLTSRDLLPDDTAWAECRAIADTLRISRQAGKPANYLLVELAAAAGRTPFVAPLAAMLAEVSGNRVLLVDTDCWRGDAVDQLSGETVRGFAEVLAQPEMWPTLVLNSAAVRVDLLPAGAATPRTRASLNAFPSADWLATLARAYDIVLLHASWPAGDALASLAAAADATLLIAPLGDLDQDVAEQAVNQLRTWGAHIQGCVVVEGGGREE